MEATLRKRVTDLIDKATDKASLAVEPAVYNQLKLACRTSEQAVEVAFDLLLLRLKDTNAQVRLHSLCLCDDLFLRSKGFRALMAPQINTFLALSVGHRSDSPLPGPAETATQLRQKALEVLERWDERFGNLYAEVRLAHRYLKDVLHIKFPELQARAAAAQAEAREQQARAQAIAQDKYERLSIAFVSHLAELLIPVEELERTFALLEGGSNTRGNLTAAQEDADWEDVQPEEEAAEGLAAYTGAALPHDHLMMVQDIDPALAETAVGAVKQLQAHCLPTIQDWVRIVTKAEGGQAGTPEHARHNEIMHAAVGARTRISNMLARFDKLHAALDAAIEHAGRQQQHDESHTSQQPEVLAEEGQPEGQDLADDKASAAAVMQEVFGDSDEDHRSSSSSSGSSESGSDLDAFIDSLQAKSSAHKPQPDLSSGAKPAPVREPVPAKQHPKQASSLPSAARNSRPIAHKFSAKQGQQPSKPNVTARLPTKSSALASQRAGGEQAKSAMSANLKEKLLAQAPVMPSGQHLAYWDSDKARALVNARGLELSNHWGPVDAHKELSEEVLAQFFGTRASYYQPPSAEEQQARAAQAAAAQAQVAEQAAAAQPTTAASSGQPATPRVTAIANPLLAGLPQRKSVPVPPAMSPPHCSAPTSASTLASQHAPVAQTAEPQHRSTPHRPAARAPERIPGAQQPAPARGPAAGDARAAGKDAAARQRAQDRAHNAALLGQLPDVEVARNLADADAAAAKALGRTGRGNAAKRKPQASIRMRLAKRLLTPKGSNAALGEVTHVESEVWREREGNNW